MSRKFRKSKWGDVNDRVIIPGCPPHIPNELNEDELEALLMRIRIEEITNKIKTNDLEVDTSEDRSPSPPPRYDSNGKRTNTREQRTKEALYIERQLLIQKAQKINPLFRPPPDYRQITIRKHKKIYIPVDKFPEYNFIGLIIGPRGLTQKKMEQQSGAKIAIRGKGSMKDGKGRIDKMNIDDDKLHVLITAETEEQIEIATREIEKLLVPVEEGRNEHKREQLRKLAEINGTLRDNAFIRGNNYVEEDNRSSSFNIHCKICGESSHPTRDCALKGQIKAQQFDNEYENFKALIGDTSLDANLLATEQEKKRKRQIAELESPFIYQTYCEFMKAIDENPQPPEEPENHSNNNGMNNNIDQNNHHNNHHHQPQQPPPPNMNHNDQPMNNQFHHNQYSNSNNNPYGPPSNSHQHSNPYGPPPSQSWM